MTSLRPLCVTCAHPLSLSLFFAKADLRFCECCLSVTRVIAPRPERPASTALEMTGAAVLRLVSALESDPGLQATLASDDEQHWLLQLPPVHHVALDPYREASAVRLARDAQLALARPLDGRRYL